MSSERHQNEIAPHAAIVARSVAAIVNSRVLSYVGPVPGGFVVNGVLRLNDTAMGFMAGKIAGESIGRNEQMVTMAGQLVAGWSGVAAAASMGGL